MSEENGVDTSPTPTRETAPSSPTVLSHEEEEERVPNHDNNHTNENPKQEEEPSMRGTRLEADEDWDLGSPLLPQRARRNRNRRTNRNLRANDSDGGSSSDLNRIYPYIHEQQQQLQDSYTSFEELMAREENLASIAAAASIDPYHFYYTIAASSMCMLFACLVVGSFFFPWSDTRMHVSFDTIVENLKNDTANGAYDDDGGENIKMDTVVGNRVDFNVPLYTNAMFQSAMAAFQSSSSPSSSFAAHVMMACAILVPAFCMMIQFILVGACYLMGPPSSPSLRLQWDGEDPIQTRKKWLNSRTFLKSPLWMMKFAMVIVYVYAILSVCLSNVMFALGGDYSPDADRKVSVDVNADGYGDVGGVGVGSTGSESGRRSLDEETIRKIEEAKEAGLYLLAQVTNEARGGVIAYLLGIMFGTGAFMILKAQLSRGMPSFELEHEHETESSTMKNSDHHDDMVGDSDFHPPGASGAVVDENQEEEEQGPSDCTTSQFPQKTPPPAAFRMTHSSHSQSPVENDDEEGEETQAHNSTLKDTASIDGLNGLDGLGMNMNNSSDSEDDGEEIFDDGPNANSDNLHQDNDLSQPLLPRHRHHPDDHENVDDAVGDADALTWSEILLFEASLFSFLLYIPLLFAQEPLMKVQYSGILTPVLDQVAYDAFYESEGGTSASARITTGSGSVSSSPIASISLTFFTMIWNITTNNGGGPVASYLFPIVTWMTLWTSVFLIPTISWLCCSLSFLLTMMKSTVWSTSKIMAIPKLLHPLSHMTPFVMSLLIVATSLQSVSMYLFNQNQFCEMVLKSLGMHSDGDDEGENHQCLLMSGNLQPMMYVLLAQSLAMDYYITVSS